MRKILLTRYNCILYTPSLSLWVLSPPTRKGFLLERKKSMAVVRINKTADYTVMSNAHFKEKEMTLKAKGLLSLMLSLPDTWDYSIAGLVTLSKDGKDSVMNALLELESFGYLIRTRMVDEKGRFAGYDYDIYEHPQREKPFSENPNTEKPNSENPTQLNTKELNTNQSSNKDIYIAILSYLNEKAGTAYRPTSRATQSHINARLAEGFTVEDFYAVIDKKCAEWKGDSKMEQYLRPATLFGTKFESYLNAPATTNKGRQENNNATDDFMAQLQAMYE